MLTDQQKTRRDELLAKDTLTDDETTELHTLTAAEDFLDKDISPAPDMPMQTPSSADPDHSPELPPAPPLSDEDKARLVQLRGLRSRTDDEAAELDALGARESAAAGHVEPLPSREPVPVISNLMVMADHLIAALKHIASTVPAAGPIGRMAAAAETHLAAARAEMTDSPPK